MSFGSKKGMEAEWKKRIENEVLSQIASEKTRKELADFFLRGAVEGRELEVSFRSLRDKIIAEKKFNQWIKRAKEQIVWLDKNDYSRALIRALKLSLNFVSADYDRTKKRDWSQVWTDTARGFLGEIALSKFFKENFGIELLLDNSRTSLEKALESDVIGIKLQNGMRIEPAERLSIKTSKFQARWLDIPGDQINRSDIFFLVKIGISDKHFLSYLKEISFLRDKLFREGVSIQEISKEEADEIWNAIEGLDPIPAYISGFFIKKEIQMPIQEVKAKAKRVGKDKFKIEITKALGLITSNYLREYFLSQEDNLECCIERVSRKKEEKERFVEEIIDAIKNGKVEYEISGIKRTINSDYKHFLASSGSLIYGIDNFEKVLKLIIGEKDV